MKKDKKGQMSMLSLILVGFVAILVGVIFLQIIAQQVGSSVNTVDLANLSFTSGAVGDSVYLDYRAIDSPVIYNATGTLVPAANYTVTNNVVNPTTGALSVQVETAAANIYAGQTWNISGTAQPTTYIADGGGRAMANLIVIMFALAVLVVSLSPTVQSKMLDLFGK